MSRKILALALTLSAALAIATASTPSARGGDFGKLLENAAKNAIRDAIAPEGPPGGRDRPQSPQPEQPFFPPGQPFSQPGQPYQQPGQPFSQPGQPFSQPGQPYQQPGQPYQQPGQPYQQPGQPFQQPGQPYQQPGRPIQQPERSPLGIVESLLSPDSKSAGEPLTIKTADGWTLVALRYRPGRGLRPGSKPVILCHGLTYNAAFWDLDPSCSLAEYLSGQGYDVWAVSLRGSGLSQKWVFRLDDAPGVFLGDAMRKLTKGKLGPTGYATIDPKYARWTLDDHINYDVPALVQLVRRTTGAPDVTWIGHSMGGIVALCHLGRFQNPGIGRLVTVGSQVTMPNGQVAIQFAGEMLVTRQAQLAGQLNGAELLRQTNTSVHNMFFNERNTSPAVYEALSTWAVDVPSIGVLQQYMTLGTKGELLDASKQFSYAKTMGNVTVPVLLACGATDQFAPPVVQQYLFDHVGSTDKAMLVIGRAQGFAADAGHDDALVGLISSQQVYPTIEGWIEARP